MELELVAILVVVCVVVVVEILMLRVYVNRDNHNTNLNIMTGQTDARQRRMQTAPFKLATISRGGGAGSETY